MDERACSNGSVKVDSFGTSTLRCGIRLTCEPRHVHSNVIVPTSCRQVKRPSRVRYRLRNNVTWYTRHDGTPTTRYSNRSQSLGASNSAHPASGTLMTVNMDMSGNPTATGPPDHRLAVTHCWRRTRDSLCPLVDEQGISGANPHAPGISRPTDRLSNVSDTRQQSKLCRDYVRNRAGFEAFDHIIEFHRHLHRNISRKVAGSLLPTTRYQVDVPSL